MQQCVVTCVSVFVRTYMRVSACASVLCGPESRAGCNCGIWIYIEA